MNLSSFGFGCYRVNELVEEHGASLKKALLNGINVIDTSANYADGGSETMIGKVLAEMQSAGVVNRGNLLLVTKGGYIQGKNLVNVRARAEEGKPFGDVFEFSDKLWHSISPDFLEDQIGKQLARLRTSYIDIYLLHNPEYALSYKVSKEEPVEKRRESFYERIGKAFAYLEGKVKEGVIRSYGVSSNTFVSYKESPEFVSLEKCIEAAEVHAGSGNHFDSVQFPLNLFESGAVSIRNNRDGSMTVLELAREKRMRVFVNRPLNAITGTGLVRLAGFRAEEFREKDFIRQIELIKSMESDLLEERLPAVGTDTEELASLARVFANGNMIENDWKFFGSIEHFNDMIMQIYTPRIMKATDIKSRYAKNESLSEFLSNYITESHRLMNFVSNYYKLRAAKRNVFINRLIDEFLAPEYHSLPLSQKALLITSSVDGVDSVLLGMRKPAYVDDALQVMQMQRIHNSPEIIEHVSMGIFNLKP